ncbi:phosphoglycerate mutase [Xenorhabdus vietnamensis]|uniref:Phosphoglycerate mutase n=2 Tax=Xenorhabdus vietnamensis TaxID=351656 RepID=A0A1Y2SE30_9GAMM|nr:phosphoglycerate mutase [Xenorhabdus vietnamensis]
MIAAPEGESANDVAQRMLSYLQFLATNDLSTSSCSIKSHDKMLCLVTHGFALQSLIWQLKGGHLHEETKKYAHLNCSYSVIDIKDKNIEVVNWGVATHLLNI